MIIGARDLGLSTDDAVEELIDNSFDADAQNVHVKVEENGEHLRIYVEDDGHGIPPVITDPDGQEWDGLTYVLSFGGSHANSDVSIGKFGWGLSASATCQSLRTTVYTKTKDEDQWRSTYIDIEEMREQRDTVPPAAEPCELPDDLDIEDREKDSGTIVVFEKCDKPDKKRVNAMTSMLVRELSRIYRHYIDGGRTLNVNYINGAHTLTVNGKELNPSDPLYMIEDCHNPGDIPIVDDPYHEETIEVESPEDGDDTMYEVSLKVIWLDVEEIRSKDEWSPGWMRKHNLTENYQGFSLIRNGREIDRGLSLKLFKKHGDKNYMRGEIEFPPQLDRYFGIQTNKSRFSLKDPVKDQLDEALGGVPNQIHRKTRKKIDQLKAEAKKEKRETEPSLSEKVAKDADKYLKDRQNLSEKEEEELKEEIREKKQQEIQRILEEEENLNEDEMEEKIEQIERKYDSFMTDPFKVTPETVGSGKFYEADFRGKQAHVKINTDHLFHDIYSGLHDVDADDELSEAAVLIDLILLAAAHAELRYEDNEEMLTWLDRFQDEWSGALKMFLKQKPDAEAESIKDLVLE
nr:ATP-binding protein [Natrinema thermotolerans]